MTRTIRTDEAIEKCAKVAMRTCDPVTTSRYAAWLETLKLLKDMGFKRVAYEDKITKG